MNNSVALGIVLCLVATTTFAQPEVSGSFHNLSKPLGGPVSTGDIIEIRAVISIPQFTDISRLRFTDLVPAGTVYVPNSMKTITNEGDYGGGITNTGIYTDIAGDDVATFVSGNTIHINMGDVAGNGTAVTDGGNVSGGITIPRFQDRATIVQAAYRVQVTATANQSIILTGRFEYRNSSASDIIADVQPRSITILPELNCSGVGFFNLILAENGGTFSNGTAHDRGASPNTFGFNYTPVAMYTPDDGSYSITKNSSPTENDGVSPVVFDKVFGIWDIKGDHTGSFNAIGNPPAAPGVNGGYMLLVNASYAPNAIFTTTVNNLIPGTIYTLSFWVRNICSLCGYDPISGNAVFAPGVKPNLAFSVNGEDLYTTGDLPYTGDWVEKSFTFSSGALSSANITIKNNAPGGGGNDWVLDDISITSCITLLPVALDEFTANPLSEGVLLSWKTGTEQQTENFIVEYSNDGRSFQPAGTVAAKGSNQEYSFVHNSKLTSKSFYRLKFTEGNGKFSYSKILVLDKNTTESGFVKVINNPARQMPEFRIYSAKRDNAEIRIVDASGKLYGNYHLSLAQGYSPFNLPAMGKPAPGVYFMQIKTNSKTTTVKFLVR